MKLYIKILTIISLFIFVTSCSDKPLTLGDIGEAAAESFENVTGVFDEEGSEDYMSSQSVAMLIIPPRLDTPQYTENLKIPKSIDGRDGEIDELVNAPVLPKFINLEIRKEGVARWLEVEVDPVSLWPYVVKFWEMQGYTISYKNPITGSIETDWKEISRNIKVERKLKTHNENYSTYKEKFFTRLEREPNGYTNIFITQEALEIDNVLDNKKILWKKIEPQIFREAELTIRLMEFLGNSRNESIALLNDSEKENTNKFYLDLVNFGGAHALVTKDSLSKAWREIGISINRSGMRILDFDRTKFIYLISSNDNEKFEIKIATRNQDIVITAHKVDNNQKYLNSTKTILQAILNAYRLDVSLAQVKSDFENTDFIKNKRLTVNKQKIYDLVISDIKNSLEQWKLSWESGDFEKYLEFYDPSYFDKSKFKSRNEWIGDRISKVNSSKNISLQIDNPDFKMIDKNTFEVKFTQLYSSNNYKDKTFKIIRFSLTEGVWLITLEKII